MSAPLQNNSSKKDGNINALNGCQRDGGVVTSVYGSTNLVAMAVTPATAVVATVMPPTCTHPCKVGTVVTDDKTLLEIMAQD